MRPFFLELDSTEGNKVLANMNLALTVEPIIDTEGGGIFSKGVDKEVGATLDFGDYTTEVTQTKAEIMKLLNGETLGDKYQNTVLA